jgi:hypothetical protein
MVMLILATGLAGCNAADEGSAPRAYVDPLRFDGSYKGTEVLAVNQSPTCPAPQHGVVLIGDNSLSFAYTPNIIFMTDIQPDGSIHALQDNTTLDGRITGDRLTLTVRRLGCQTDYAGTFILNHS